MTKQESSVVCSLQSLLALEEDRVRDEESRERERQQIEQQAREARRRQELDAERQRLEAQEQQRREAELRSREEATRLEALRVATIEKARIEAESRATLAALEQQRAHAAELARVEAATRRRRDRIFLIGTNVSMGLLLVAAIGIYVGRVHPDGVKREAELKNLITLERERADTAERLARQATQKTHEVEMDLMETQQALADLRAAPTIVEKPVGGDTRVWIKKADLGNEQAEEPPPEKRCLKGDPLCEWLGR